MSADKRLSEFERSKTDPRAGQPIVSSQAIYNEQLA